MAVSPPMLLFVTDCAVHFVQLGVALVGVHPQAFEVLAVMVKMVLFGIVQVFPVSVENPVSAMSSGCEPHAASCTAVALIGSVPVTVPVTVTVFKVDVTTE